MQKRSGGLGPGEGAGLMTLGSGLVMEGVTLSPERDPQESMWMPRLPMDPTKPSTTVAGAGETRVSLI